MALVLSLVFALGVLGPTLGAPVPAPLPDDTPLPLTWGSPIHALKAQPPGRLKKKHPADQLLPLPPPDRTLRLPQARLQIGPGRVDPVLASTAAGGAYIYVVKAGTPGVVEYIYPTSGSFEAGQALVRLYDLAILADLRIGESAMARFASSPFVIAPASSTLPPLPPGTDFPRPIAGPQGLGIRLMAPLPTVAPILAPELPDPVTPRRSGLARAPGLATIKPPDTPRVERSAGLASASGGPSVPDMTELTDQLSDTHSRLETLGSALGRLDDEMAAARARVDQARLDEANSQRLYNQGVLARNVWETTQAKLRSAQGDVEELQRKRVEMVAAREQASQRSVGLQNRIDQCVAERGRQAAEDTRRTPHVLREGRAINERALDTEVPRPVRTAARRRPPIPPAAHFPAPTAPQRPELAALPRTPRSAARLTPSLEVPAVPEEAKRLSAPRWRDEMANSDGIVVKQLVPDGSQVKAGTPLLEVANRDWARLYADIRREDIAEFRKGAPLQATFDEYPGVRVEGWINGLTPVPHSNLTRVEMVVLCREGYYPDDTYASLQWLALAAPLLEKERREPLEASLDLTPTAKTSRGPVYELLPLVPPTVGPGQEPVQRVKPGEFTGVIRLGETDLQANRKVKQNPAQTRRLAALKKWRDSFIAGMRTTVFGDLMLTYPREGEIARAVERMATAQVSHDDNRCARTLREALGWGLGDAAVWMKRLPERGYLPRQDGLARPGDILVWPFTYGPRRSQHIGVAVSQKGKLMLLSNLAGTLGTTELVGGYIAFYQPPGACELPAAGVKRK